VNKTDTIYTSLLERISQFGEEVQSRNGPSRRLFTLPTVTFDTTPLVTIRHTAWKKAIREMEWFLSGKPRCPDELLDWWDGQLNPNGLYLNGYGEQLRSFNFDQIKHLIHKLRTDPFSREHVITTWNPVKMAFIKETNNNPRTPACCHSTVVQFFVSKDSGISMHSYQRSADMLLGVPHNWIQSWAFLLWVCAQVEGVPEKMLWTFGDAHVYIEPSHTEAISQILNFGCMSELSYPAPPRLVYNGSSKDAFFAEAFEMIGTIPLPITAVKPKLL
jgi:thymidylate synthase